MTGRTPRDADPSPRRRRVRHAAVRAVAGLAVTMGLMNFINLAHAAFAMLGGYVHVRADERAGVPFLATLPLAFIVPALIGALLERTLYRPMYASPHLDQVLFTIGLVFMAVAAVDYVMGSLQINLQTPEFLHGRFEFGRARSASALPAVHRRALRRAGARAAGVLARTRFGSRLRAAVDDPRVAVGPGHQCQPRVLRHLRGRLGPGGSRRRAGRRRARARPELPV